MYYVKLVLDKVLISLSHLSRYSIPVFILSSQIWQRIDYTNSTYNRTQVKKCSEEVERVNKNERIR